MSKTRVANKRIPLYTIAAPKISEGTHCPLVNFSIGQLYMFCSTTDENNNVYLRIIIEFLSIKLVFND